MRNTSIFSTGLTIALSALAALQATAQRAPSALQAMDRAGAISKAGPAAAPASVFWTVLRDTTLDRLLDRALEGNLELRAAAARVDGASAGRLQAALEMAPVVTASGGYTRRRLASATFPGLGSNTLPDEDLWNSGLNATWELDLFGRLRGSLGAQNALLGASTASERDARVALAADVARAYLELRGAQGQLGVARRNAENQRHTLQLTQTRLDAGRGTAFDTERARAQLSSTLAAIPTLEARVSALQHRIAVLLGHAPGELGIDLSAEVPLPDFPDTVPSGDAVEVVRARPDIQAAERQMAASRSLASAARADFLPRIGLSASAGYLAGTPNQFGRNGTFNFAVGPVVSWAAFDLGRVKARVDQAQALELEARAHYQQAVLGAREELETATVRYRTARARLAYLRDAATASEKAASLARLRFEGGIVDFLQVLDAERTLLAAQDQAAQAQTDVADAYVALARAQGADWQARPGEAR